MLTLAHNCAPCCLKRQCLIRCHRLLLVVLLLLLPLLQRSGGPFAAAGAADIPVTSLITKALQCVAEAVSARLAAAFVGSRWPRRWVLTGERHQPRELAFGARLGGTVRHTVVASPPPPLLLDNC